MNPIPAESALEPMPPALSRAVLAIGSDLSLPETLKHIVTEAAGLVDAEFGALGVPGESGEQFAEFVTTGLAPGQAERIPQRPQGLGMLALILGSDRVVRLNHIDAHPQSAGFPRNHPALTSLLGAPIHHQGRRMGSLYLANKRGAEEFSARDERLIEVFAAHAGVAIENARQYEQVQQLRILEERQRIGMDLHDGVIQSIYAVGLNLEYISSMLADGETADASQRLQGAIGALNATIRDIRTYILDLRPRHFDGDDLVAGLRRLLAEFKANMLLQVDFSTDPQADRELTPEARRALFRIAQEALSNSARHSRATRVEVRLREYATEVVLTLRDDGHGFSMERAEQRIGHGLRNMRDRAVAIGGLLAIDSAPGRGSTVTVRAPKPRPGPASGPVDQLGETDGSQVLD